MVTELSNQSRSTEPISLSWPSNSANTWTVLLNWFAATVCARPLEDIPINETKTLLTKTAVTQQLFIDIFWICISRPLAGVITVQLVSSYTQNVPAIVIDKHSSIDMYTYVFEDFMTRESTP